jgi:uncharacterized protein (TIGR00369 family)
MTGDSVTGERELERELDAEAPVWRTRTDDYEEIVRRTFAEQNAMAHIGARMGRVEPGLVEIHLPCREELMQQYQAIHGGIVGMIADSACAFAALTIAPKDTIGVTVEYKINMVAPGIGEELIARGRLVRPGQTITVTAADVFVIRNGRQRLIATALETLVRVR